MYSGKGMFRIDGIRVLLRPASVFRMNVILFPSYRSRQRNQQNEQNRVCSEYANVNSLGGKYVGGKIVRGTARHAKPALRFINSVQTTCRAVVRGNLFLEYLFV